MVTNQVVQEQFFFTNFDNISENYEDVMESILGQTSLGNLNYAPMNTNVQNFVNINTEIDTDIDINVSFFLYFLVIN